jgi:hypothetical protein
MERRLAHLNVSFIKSLYSNIVDGRFLAFNIVVFMDLLRYYWVKCVLYYYFVVWDGNAQNRPKTGHSL